MSGLAKLRCSRELRVLCHRSAAGVVLAVVAAVFAGVPASAATVPFAEVKAIFERRCQMCHGAQIQMSGLRLDQKDSALKGGDSGKPSIVPGNNEQSLLIRYVAGLDPKIVMPPSGAPLSPEQVALLRSWVDEGADWPAGSARAGEPAQPRNTHWAFQPIADPQPPAVKRWDWVNNPIDQFVLAKLEAKGWEPAPAAGPSALLRRMYLGIIGLPPTPEEHQEFLQDPSAARYRGVVDDLLANPGYGESWGRYWLDVVRYAETNGYERDAKKPHVWRYRDYVIQSLNGDKPFDRFVTEQVAGDELPDVSAETLVATGFYRIGPWDDEPADEEQDQFDQLDDMVRVTSEAFLGLTLGCARCHDHKFDPVTARDYYRMVAIFHGLERPRRGRTEFDSPIGTPQQLQAEAERDRLIAPLAAAIEKQIAPWRLEFLRSGKSSLPPQAVEGLLVPEEQRTVVQMVYADAYAKKLDEEVRPILPAEVRAAIASLEEKIAAIRAQQPDLPRGYFLREPGPQFPATPLLKRGSVHNAGEEVPPGVPAVLPAAYHYQPNSHTSGRRLALARWLTSRENPLTARVIVNRVWQRHFGEGLVRTPNNFGLIGEKPAHPELLDWLANWFMREGWSLKKLHRLIMTSSTYRMSKTWNARYAEEDPENRLLWRTSRRRLDAEAIRDSILAVSGRLNRKMFGESMYPKIAEAVLKASKADDSWEAFNEEDASRRTIYAHVKRSMIVPMLETLDFCDTTRPSGKRMVSTVAPQALTLFNGEFVNQQAEYLAARLISEAGWDAERQIERAYLLAFTRRPKPEEREAMVRFLQEQAQNLQRAADPKTPLDGQRAREQALQQMCRVILNLNEFVYTD